MDKYIELSHGAGGLKMDQLLKSIQSTFSKRNTSETDIGMDAFDDGAIFSMNNQDLVISTDGHSVDPLFFPGGDIGKLAMCGTVNDLVMMGAEPIAITSSLLIEEGFEWQDLKTILNSMNAICEQEQVPIIAGDTKVIPKGKLDKLMIVTTGIGKRISKERILDANVRVADQIIVTGSIGSHGISLMSFREGLSFKTTLKSDVASLRHLLLPLVSKYSIHAMKDPTRGGIASALNEWAEKSRVEIHIDQENVPIHPSVQSAADLLGLDPFEITCEGKAILAVPKDESKEILNIIRNNSLGKDAQIIGEVFSSESSKVLLKTSVGGLRRLQKPLGELIPRVC
ncbi:MAG: Hydrogenase expression/formation protein HypE [Candidatus Heimdallarchaeota archaeon LC_3]|nr:MAG: Hydrogenase expression/formation protein HypE [Candidatus Heimdallarchaeota archaeon LC_3]